MKKHCLLFCTILVSFSLYSQKPKQLNSGEIYHALQKLNFLGTALYVAAHPDDENTRLISYLSNEVKANTAYLSLTRGDGGQNLIGTEIQELLGVLRTQELLAARRIDGGSQFFTRANDFGYSKHPDETLEIWNKEEVLADVVWVMRNFKPDIIINRFDHRRAGRTHGHHTSSALLSNEAFDLVNDKTKYPEQLQHTEVWQPTRLYYNTSWWRYGSREKFAEVDKSKMAIVDVGVYYPVLGKSNSEIASEARSMHKCQGFGSTGSRGTSTEYLELVKGDLHVDREDPFSGINTTWSRVEGGAPIQVLMESILSNFDYSAPSKSVEQLLEVRFLIEQLSDDHWKKIKLKEINTIIESCMGLYLEAYTDISHATPGEQVELTLECTNRSKVNAKIRGFSILPQISDTILNQSLENNVANKWFKNISVPNMANSYPYWINGNGELGMYDVQDQSLIGKPESPRNLKVEFELELNGHSITIQKDIIHKFNDRVQGEVVQPFEIVNDVSLSIENDSYFFSDNNAQSVKVYVKAGKNNVKGILKLDLGRSGWKSEPPMQDFNIALKGDQQEFEFMVTPPKAQNVRDISLIAEIEGKPKFMNTDIIIDYDHIPLQTVSVPAKSKFVKIEIDIQGKNVGYIEGAGDKVAESLEQVGYNVSKLDIASLRAENLRQYNSIVIGIRALNTKDELKFKMKELLEYAENGGTLVVQYNTTRGLKVKDFSPFPLKLSRDRVSDEYAEVRILQEEHPVLNFPNSITSKDFDGWIQERGLYFPNEWDDNYKAILSMNDKGEDPKDGSLLVAEYGKGYFVYSGISWFRELPAGVPGAFRLFANILALSQKRA